MVSMADRQYVWRTSTSTPSTSKIKISGATIAGALRGDFGTSVAISFPTAIPILACKSPFLQSASGVTIPAIERLERVVIPGDAVVRLWFPQQTSKRGTQPWISRGEKCLQEMYE